MGNTILIRRGTTTPAGGSFSPGEPAWDNSAGKLYVRNNAGVMVCINPMATVASQTILGRSSAGAGDVEALTGGQVLSLIGAQAADADLTALASLSTTGLAVRTGSNVWSARAIAAGSSRVSISNGDGVSGNPTIDVAEANLTIGNLGGTLANSKLATMATETIKGRIAAGTGSPEDLTIVQVRKLLRRAKHTITSPGTSHTLNIANGLYQVVTLSANWTLNFPSTAPEEGESVFLYVKQPGSGGPYTLTLGTGFQAPGGRSSITLSTAASSVDRIEIFFDTTTTATVTITKDIKA